MFNSHRQRAGLGSLAVVGVGSSLAIVLAGNPLASEAASGCADVEVIFARGTTEAPGLGSVGGPFLRAVQTALPGTSVTSYAVNYPADVAQSQTGLGATDMSNHLTATARQCADTQFVIGGYSQGASVTDIAIGVGGVLGRGTAIPATLASRVAAVAVFGNPLRRFSGPITTLSSVYGPKAIDLCASGDPVCSTGASVLAHLTYATSGATTQAAKFVATKVKITAGGTAGPPAASPSADPGTDPAPTGPTGTIDMGALTNLLSQLKAAGHGGAGQGQGMQLAQIRSLLKGFGSFAGQSAPGGVDASTAQGAVSSLGQGQGLSFVQMGGLLSALNAGSGSGSNGSGSSAASAGMAGAGSSSSAVSSALTGTDLANVQGALASMGQGSGVSYGQAMGIMKLFAGATTGTTGATGAAATGAAATGAAASGQPQRGRRAGGIDLRSLFSRIRR